MDVTRIVALIPLLGLGQALRYLLRPMGSVITLAIGAAGDVSRTRSQLLVETALLRQQLIVLRRSMTRPRLHRGDRLLLVLLARLTSRWRQVLQLVNPETLLGWHRDLFKIIWRRKPLPKGQPKRLAPELVILIQAMAKDNVLRGAERLRGELLKPGIRVSKRTIQKYMRRVRPPEKRGQTLAHLPP